MIYGNMPFSYVDLLTKCMFKTMNQMQLLKIEVKTSIVNFNDISFLLLSLLIYIFLLLILLIFIIIIIIIRL